ncbi:MAG: hypothetical protein JJU33_00655 [Phycisphaerales bacterium]|nr:hypothetical protein [Phycisphaerales bacterium]
MEFTKRITLFPIGLVLVLWTTAAHGQWVGMNQPAPDEALAKLVLFGEGLPVAERAGFEVKLSMLVAVGEPNETDASYEFLLQAAESGEAFPVDRVDALRLAFDRAHRADEGVGAGRTRAGEGPYLSQSRSIVTSSEGPGRVARTQTRDGILPANTQAGAIADAGVVELDRMLVGVRIFGSEMTQDQFGRLMRTGVLARSSLPPLVASSVYLRDGEAFAAIGRYRHPSLDLPVTVVAMFECRSIEVEDLHLVLIECDADSELARRLSKIGPDAPMVELSEPRQALSREVIRSHFDGELSVLLRSRSRSAGRNSAGRGSVEHMDNFHRPRIDAFRFEYSAAGGDPRLRLDLGFGDEPIRVAAPQPSRHSVMDHNGVLRRLPSLTGDLRVLLSGEKDGRFRAILCLQVASYTDD